jgi:hypothetical protein
MSDVNGTSVFTVDCLKMETAGFSETLISGYRTAWHHMPEGSAAFNSNLSSVLEYGNAFPLLSKIRNVMRTSAVKNAEQCCYNNLPLF